MNSLLKCSLLLVVLFLSASMSMAQFQFGPRPISPVMLYWQVNDGLLQFVLVGTKDLSGPHTVKFCRLGGRTGGWCQDWVFPQGLRKGNQFSLFTAKADGDYYNFTALIWEGSRSQGTPLGNANIIVGDETIRSFWTEGMGFSLQILHAAPVGARYRVILVGGGNNLFFELQARTLSDRLLQKDEVAPSARQSNQQNPFYGRVATLAASGVPGGTKIPAGCYAVGVADDSGEIFTTRAGLACLSEEMILQ